MQGGDSASSLLFKQATRAAALLCTHPPACTSACPSTHHPPVEDVVPQRGAASRLQHAAGTELGGDISLPDAPTPTWRQCTHLAALAPRALEPHRLHLKVADVLGAAARAALRKAVAVQLRQTAAGQAAAQVQAVNVLADQVGELASALQGQQHLVRERGAGVGQGDLGAGQRLTRTLQCPAHTRRREGRGGQGVEE